MNDLKEVLSEICKEKILKVVISNKSNKDFEFNKISILMKEKNEKQYYFIEKFTNTQVFHENINLDDLCLKLQFFIDSNFKQVNLWSENNTFDIKISKKKKINLSKKSSINNIKQSSHNKEKNYILKQGMIIEPLIDLGIFTKEGKVINSKYDKYKQINRFIEIIDDEVKKNDYKELTILDFGCGKSYLTFVLYYYFTKIKNIDIKMIGLDLKESVINKCNDIAKRYNYSNLTFELGDINGFKYNNKVDMVITLHACNTATDYAIFNAVKWNAKMIFSAPCCQHELNTQMKTDNLSILTNYGVVQERICALMTDSIRANLLGYLGYKTQLLEFIDISHSPKNLLIRASKANISEGKRVQYLEEVKKIMNEFNFNPTLYKLLKEDSFID